MTKDVKNFTKLPTILSFDRRLEPSDGLLFSGKWENRNQKVIKPSEPNDAKPYWQKVKVERRGNLGTKSQYKLGKGSRIDPNPVEGDKAVLFEGDDTLKLNFNLKILGSVGVPTACNNSNDPEFSNILSNVVNDIKSKGGLKEIAFRYAYNIANGRFLWRNRLCAEEIEVQVSHHTLENPLAFSAFKFGLKSFDKEKDNTELSQLADLIFAGLMDDDDGFTFLTINAYARMGNRAQVFPSQVMNIGEDEKVLFQLNNCAGMHDVKIGNAIRTIDTWYPEYDGETHLPIAIDPFGIVTQIGKVYRDDKVYKDGNEQDLYSYLKKVPTRENGAVSNDDLFFIANLIRGGLFQGESSK